MEFLLESSPIQHPDINLEHKFTNVILIDRSTPNYQLLVESANSDTFPISYSYQSTKTELQTFLAKYFTQIDSLALIFTSSGDKTKLFLDQSPLFTDTEAEAHSENLSFIVELIKQFKVKNINFLACRTLKYSSWKNYYELLHKEINIPIGASNDLTGNIKYGGDWIMESTQIDIRDTYFTDAIQYYQDLLDVVPVWADWSTQGVDGPFGLAIYGGYLYVANYYSNTISKINIADPTNNPIKIWANGAIQGLSGPTGLAIYEGYLYVTNSNGSISKINITDPTNNPTKILTQGLNGPNGLAIDVDGGYLYVSNNNNNTISKINIADPTQNFTQTWADYTQGLNQPQGLAIDGGYLYVANPGYSTISKINIADPTNNPIQIWANNAIQGLSGPNGLAIYGGYLYVANYDNNTISKINITDPTNNPVQIWADSTQGLFGLKTLAIDEGQLYASNTGNNTISKISLSYVVCFLKGTQILTKNGYIPIQQLSIGEDIQIQDKSYKKLKLLGKQSFHYQKSNKSGDQLYQYDKDKNGLIQDLIVTGHHPILTAQNSRVLSCQDSRAHLYENEGVQTIYNIVLEDDILASPYMVYANGMLAEACSTYWMEKKSNMYIYRD